MGNKNSLIRIGPAALTAAIGTLFSSTGTNQMRFLLRQITVCNITESPAFFSLWLSLSDPAGAPSGADLLYANKAIPANETLNFYFTPGIRVRYSDYISQQASDDETIICTLSMDSFPFDWQDEN